MPFGFGRRGRKKETLPDLHFKGNREAFEYACQYMSGEIREKQALAALVVDGSNFQDAVQVLIQQFEAKSDENIFDTYRVKVSGDGSGFDAPALCYKKGATIVPGDLVYWVPMQRDPMLQMLGDGPSDWIGGIVAKLTPTLSMQDGWVIAEHYM